jgi:hypothetical protein
MDIILEIVLSSILLPIMPVFYFALYRNEGYLRFSERLRILALAAAVGMSVVTAEGLPRLLESLSSKGSGSVLIEQRVPWTITDASYVAGVFSNIIYILLLIAVFRQPDSEPQSQVPISKFLSVITKVAVIAWTIWVAFNLVRLLITPYTYSLLRNYALQNGVTPPPFRNIVAGAARTLLSQSSLFALPYIVLRSSRRHDVPPYTVPEQQYAG